MDRTNTSLVYLPSAQVIGPLAQQLVRTRFNALRCSKVLRKHVDQKICLRRSSMSCSNPRR